MFFHNPQFSKQVHDAQMILRDMKEGIGRNKGLFAAIMIMQILLVGLFFGTLFHYQVKIIKNAQQVIQPLQQANYDPNLIQEGQPFLEDMLALQRSYIALKDNLIRLGLSLLTIYLIMQGAVWIMTQRLFFRYSWKQMGLMWVKFVGTAMALFIPFFLASFLIIRDLIISGTDLVSFSNMARYLAIALGVWYYLSIVAYALLPIASWKSFSVAWYKTGIQHIHRTIFVVVAVVLMIGSMIAAAYFAIMKTQSFPLMLISVLLFILMIAITRIFWIAALRSISGYFPEPLQSHHHEKSHP